MKNLLTLTLLCFGLMAQAQIPSYVPTNGLVGWWPFNGNANDESGNGNNGTPGLGVTLGSDRYGILNTAYDFNGNGNISLTSIPTTGNSDFSIIAWVKTNNVSQRKGIASWGQDNAWSSTYFFITIDGFLQFDLAFYNGVKSPIFIADNSWHSVGVTCKNGLINLFLDGLPTGLPLQMFPNISGNNKAIGANIANSGNFNFNGLLDDIAIYNRALSASEVQQLYLGACAKPTFAAQPQNKSVAQGQTTTFAVQVDSASRYQWQMNLGLGAGWTNIPASVLFSGDTTATLSVQGRSTIDGAQFRCIATSCNFDTSNAATLTVTSSATAAAGSVAGVPGLINYQGSALDSLGKPMKNQTILLKLSVLDSSSTGVAVFVETHTAATNGSGHFAIQIGGGTALLGTFDSVGWANGRNKYLKSELSQNGTWVNLGTSQLVSVPYALHAGSAEISKRSLEFLDSSGNAYQIKTVNGQPTLVPAPGSASNPGSFACGQAVNYAGESYPTVQIGTQCWFQKNLNVGTMIDSISNQTNNGIIEKYCISDNSLNCFIYGGLYQWAEVMQYQNGASNRDTLSSSYSGKVTGICPIGWHIPSDLDFCVFAKYLDTLAVCTSNPSSRVAGGLLKSVSSLWDIPNSGATNTSGFFALPTGYLYKDGSSNFYNQQGSRTSFWTSTEGGGNNAYARFLSSDDSFFYRNRCLKLYGVSVRCLKD